MTVEAANDMAGRQSSAVAAGDEITDRRAGE